MIDGLKRFNVRISPNNGRYKLGKRPFRSSGENGPRPKNPRTQNLTQKPTQNGENLTVTSTLCYNIIKGGSSTYPTILKGDNQRITYTPYVYVKRVFLRYR